MAIITYPLHPQWDIKVQWPSNTSVLSCPRRVTRRHPKRHHEEEEELGDVECGRPCVEDVGKQHVTYNTRNNDIVSGHFMFSDRERHFNIPGRVG